VADLSETTSPESSPDSSGTKQRPMKQQSRAIQARWAGEQASEQELDEFFRSIPIDKGLVIIDKMNANRQRAGTILNERMSAEHLQRCKTCNKSLEELQKERGSGFRGWRLNRPHRDPNNMNMVIVDHFCSDVCIALENQSKQGVKGLSDRGMTRDINPKNHPREAANVAALHDKAI
jgi:hypothetical protein